jgi:hypothetical protein
MLGITTVDAYFARIVALECDLVFGERFIRTPVLGGFYELHPSSVSICPRTLDTFERLSRQWHDVIGKLLPIRGKTIDYPSWILAMKEAGYDAKKIESNLTGFSYIENLFEELTSPIVKPATIPSDEYVIFEEYKRSLFNSSFSDIYPTFDLWSLERFNAFIESKCYSKVYCAYRCKKKKVKFYHVSPTQNVEHLKFEVSGVTLTTQDYQQFYLDLKGVDAYKKRQNEAKQEFEAKIDYSLVPSDEDVLLGHWVATPEDITRSHRITEYLRLPDKFHLEKLKKEDFGKPPLWDAIWLFFNTEEIPVPLEDSHHDLLNDIIGRRMCDGVACWLTEKASHWLQHEPDKDDDYEYGEAYIKECDYRASIFANTLRNLCRHELVVVKKPRLESYGVINIDITPKGLETAILEAEQYDATRSKDDYGRVPLTTLVANFNQVKDWYISRGIIWKCFSGKGWYIDASCKNRAEELGLARYVESFSPEEKVALEQKKLEWDAMDFTERSKKMTEALALWKNKQASNNADG